MSSCCSPRVASRLAGVPGVTEIFVPSESRKVASVRNCQPEPLGGTVSTRPSGAMRMPVPLASVRETVPELPQTDR